MFGETSGGAHTYFADSPVVITISNLQWSRDGGAVTSPFTIVRLEVVYDNRVVGDFRADTGGQTSISFDISSALRAVWAGYDFNASGAEVAKANAALTGSVSQTAPRDYRTCNLAAYTEYLDSVDNEFTVSTAGTFGNLRCAIGRFTEWERYTAPTKADADMSSREHRNTRNGDASTKPLSSPERVGRNSITSWVDVSNSGTQSVFYPANTEMAQDGQTAHAPTVLRDSSQDYVDFLFVNRRGAVETCSGLMKEAMDIEVTTTQYARVERPSFAPSRSLMAIASGGRRSWSMSSGYQTREWAEWWAQEFLMARQWWMKYPVGDATGTFVPVIVAPTKKSVSIYDRTKQQMPHVDFTVTLAMEG